MQNNPQAPSSKRQWIPIIIAVFAIAVVVFLVVRYRQSQELVVTSYPVETTATPTLFPAGLPLEENVPILENYSATASDGRLQSTRIFETLKSLEENSAIYQEYFVTDGWTITAYKNEENYKALLAKKGGSSAQVVMNQDAEGIRTVQVSILAIQPPASPTAATTTQN